MRFQTLSAMLQRTLLNFYRSVMSFAAFKAPRNARAVRHPAIFLNPLPPKGELAQRFAPPLPLRAVYNDFGRIELTVEQLASMGATVQPNQSSEEIDVTEFVRLGKLTIR